MRQDIQMASKCFLENLGMFTNKDAEKHNLYNGLANLAGFVSSLQSEIDRLQRAVDQLSYDLRRLTP